MKSKLQIKALSADGRDRKWVHGDHRNQTAPHALFCYCEHFYFRFLCGKIAIVKNFILSDFVTVCYKRTGIQAHCIQFIHLHNSYLYRLQNYRHAPLKVVFVIYTSIMEYQWFAHRQTLTTDFGLRQSLTLFGLSLPRPPTLTSVVPPGAELGTVAIKV